MGEAGRGHAGLGWDSYLVQGGGDGRCQGAEDVVTGYKLVSLHTSLNSHPESPISGELRQSPH